MSLWAIGHSFLLQHKFVFVWNKCPAVVGYHIYDIKEFALFSFVSIFQPIFFTYCTFFFTFFFLEHRQYNSFKSPLLLLLLFKLLLSVHLFDLYLSWLQFSNHICWFLFSASIPKLFSEKVNRMLWTRDFGMLSYFL